MSFFIFSHYIYVRLNERFEVMLSIIVLSVIMVIATIEDIVLRQLPIICFSLFDVYLTVYTLYKNTFEIGMIYGLIIGSVPFLIMALLSISLTLAL